MAAIRGFGGDGPEDNRAECNRAGNHGAGESGTHEKSTVVISSPEELIASVPAMLGFPPGPGSVVLICGETSDGGQGPVVRVDANGLLAEREVGYEDDFGDCGLGDDDDYYDDDNPDRSDLVDVDVARGIARFCAREGVTGVHLVVVHEGCAEFFGAHRRAADTADVFGYWLGTAGTEVSAAYGVGEFAGDAPWTDLFGMLSGSQMDPGCTEIAAVYAFEGRVRAGSREEIEQLYRQRDGDACDVDSPGNTSFRLVGAEAVNAAVALHEDAVRRVGAGEEIPDSALAEVGAALLDIAVRDEVYGGLARRRNDDDGRRPLWWALARRRPARERSVALTLLGAAAYFSGGGVHARSALAAALDADPTNTLAGLLLTGLDNGLSPDRLRRVAAA